MFNKLYSKFIRFNTSAFTEQFKSLFVKLSKDQSNENNINATNLGLYAAEKSYNVNKYHQDYNYEASLYDYKHDYISDNHTGNAPNY